MRDSARSDQWKRRPFKIGRGRRQGELGFGAPVMRHRPYIHTSECLQENVMEQYSDNMALSGKIRVSKWMLLILATMALAWTFSGVGLIYAQNRNGVSPATGLVLEIMYDKGGSPI